MSNQSYTIKQCLEMAACTNCQICADECPAVQAVRQGEVSPIYRLQRLQNIFRSRTGGLLQKLFRAKTLSDEQWEIFSKTVFQCTLCGKCQEICPVGIGLKELWLSLRHDLVQSEHYPKKINMVRDNLLESRNVFAEDNEERGEWVEDMDDPPEDLLIREQSEVVYFTGCVAAYFPLAQKIPLALADILLKADVDFSLLGEQEWCCGLPLLNSGLPELFQEFIDHNIAAVKEKGANDVVFACPSCYEIWKKYYPYQANGLRIHHASQYLDTLIEQRKLPLKTLDMTVTYHDPCDLGRGAREFDAPRRVIQAIPGIRFVEMPNNRENCACCGGGGNLEMFDADLTTGIAGAKIEEARSTGADTIVTACQQCVRTMLTYAKRNKVPIQVLDLTQLVQKALAEEDDA